MSRPRSDAVAQFAVAARFQAAALLPLGLCLLNLTPNGLLAVLTIGLAALTLLKLLEARQLEERRLVALLQLLTAGLLAAQLPALAPSLLQLAATVMALTGLLALELGAGLDWRLLLRRCLQVLAAGLPLALVLFLLVPRLDPFATLPMAGGAAATTGLSDQLDPGSIASLASSDGQAARVSLPAGLPAPEERYWRVLVHDRFDGRQWDRSSSDRDADAASQITETPTVAQQRLPAAAREGRNTQLWVVAPSRQRAVPWSGQGQPLGKDLVLRANGELLHRGPMDRRRVYAVEASAPSPNWRRQPPVDLDVALPRGLNPRLEALGAEWGRLPTQLQRLQAARDWYRSQGFRYTLQPGRLPEQAPLDAFLFERRRGFCGHYASSFTALMRAAGVPARVVSGYRGGRWIQPLGGEGYLDLRQSDAHAWSEVWLDGSGWVSVDPSGWIDNQRTGRTSRWTGSGPTAWLEQQWWGLDLAWTRLWLGFDQQQQEALLQRLLGPWLPWLGLFGLLAAALALGSGLGLMSLLQRSQEQDAGRSQLDRLLLQLKQRSMEPLAGETLIHFGQRLSQRWPQLQPELEQLINRYQQLRFAGQGLNRRERRKLDGLFKTLGRRIQRLPQRGTPH